MVDPRQARKIGGWVYRAERSAQVRDGVPWELIVTPDSEQTDWQRGTENGTLPPLSSFQARRGDVLLRPVRSQTPAIEVPETVWKKWLAPTNAVWLLLPVPRLMRF